MNTSTLKLRSTGKKLIVILILSMFSGLSAKNNKKDDIIPGASYVVLENACVTGGVRMPCRYAEYYTFDGKLIKIITNDREDFLDYAQKKIDPKAPKPRPAKYKTNLIDTNKKDPMSSLLWTTNDVINFKKNSGLNICGVGYSLYLGSEFEPQMLQDAARIIYDAHQNGLVAILWIYPRGKNINASHLDLASGATGIANALGADFVKIKYPEENDEEISPLETLKIATHAAGNTKVICAGGQAEDTSIFLHKLHEQITIGGTCGNATGRNIFQRSLHDAIAFTNAISAIVYDNKNFHEAIAIYNSMTK